ncbi:MAG: hypothetical protein Q8T03_01990 [Bacteroidota bacterium]|nr:hypothetical protein [Bacteroidota bacterium]
MRNLDLAKNGARPQYVNTDSKTTHMTGQILKNGIYFKQIDMRQDGYYTNEENGELKKNEYKVTTKEKIKYLFFDKKPIDPIYTDFISFREFDNKLHVYSHSIMGDAITVAKQIKTMLNPTHMCDFAIKGDTVELYFGDKVRELTFDNTGNIILATIKRKDTKELILKESFSFLPWTNI